MSNDEITAMVQDMARVERELNDLANQDMRILSQAQQGQLTWEQAQTKRNELRKRAEAIKSQFESPEGESSAKPETDEQRQARELAEASKVEAEKARIRAEAERAEREAELGTLEEGDDTNESASEEAFYKALGEAKNSAELNAVMAEHGLLK